jgi:hypothetical protein
MVDLVPYLRVVEYQLLPQLQVLAAQEQVLQRQFLLEQPLTV